MAPAVATYEPRDPSRTVLYHVIADHLETFLAALDADPDATGLPAYVEREFYAYLVAGAKFGRATTTLVESQSVKTSMRVSWTSHS